MFFDRKIKYLDYVENGARIHGAGFVKLELRNGKCDLQVQVSGMHMTDNFKRQVLLIAPNTERLLGEVLLTQGKGGFCLRAMDGRDLAGTGIAYEQLSGIRIPIAAGREIYCSIQNKEEQPENRPEEAPKAVQAEKSEEQPETVSAEQSEEQSEEQPEAVQAEKSEEQLEAVQAEKSEEQPEAVQAGQWKGQSEEAPADIPAEPEVADKEASQEEEQKPGTRTEALAETKWKQLAAIYPHISPFQDEREYLSICPADFVILPDKYYRLANNSFLLHGYYNYKHLILSRLNVKGQQVYYIGVPGNFYDRERQVAILFGFESFECLSEPAVSGDYGYYMMRVEL